MFAEFHDERADQMRALAKNISSPTERFAAKSDSLAKAGFISRQFFPQEELFVQPLNTDKLLDTMGGGEDAKRARFRAALMSQFPGNSLMWAIPMPEASESPAGGAGRLQTAGKALGAALERNAAVKAALKAATAPNSEYAEAVRVATERALAAQRAW